MSYFVTGATGFIGRHLVERLLEREGEIYLLVREGSEDKLERLREDAGEQADRLKPVKGDISEPSLGLSDEDKAALEGVEHFFHLAAIYDMTASDEERNQRLNVLGTQNAVDLANELGAKHLHYASSIAVAGEHDDIFTEDDFDVGQTLTHPYHQTKFEAEKLVRQQAKVPWRVYRPAIVVGDSRTGEMDKVDGPYYFFKAIQKVRHALPEWFPLVGLEVGRTNIVPVDYVAAAMDHIAHQDGLDGRAFHLVNPKMQKVGDVMNTFAGAGHAPHMVMRVDKRMTDMLPKGVLSYAMKLPALKDIRRSVLADMGVPDEVLDYVALKPTFDARDPRRALEGSGIELPALETYAAKLWDYWERNLDPDLFKDRSFEGAVNGKTVIITGASSGIGLAAAHKIAAAGGIPLLVSRGQEKLEELKGEIEERGGTAYVYPTDLSDMDAIEESARKMLDDHPAIDMLVNNAGRSIRRSMELSHDRFHDFERTMQLNYFGAIKMTMALMPHMKERRFGHVVNVSSIGAQPNPPRFSAYVASKAALDAWTRVVSSETIGDNISFTTIHMPLVRTPMIAQTKIYDEFPTITPDEAADLVCEAIRAKPKTINLRLGTAGEVLYALAPKAVDQVLHAAYEIFPDSAAAKGQKDEKEKASMEQIAMANLMKGVHW